MILTAVVFLGIQVFVAQPFRVQQESMEPTVRPEQYVLVDKLTPRLTGYGRGDIVVFEPPATWADPGTEFIKRVIGLPGDRVELRDGAVYIDGALLREPYLLAHVRTDPIGSERAWTVPSGELFVMGDNRPDSADSRVFGPVPIASVTGRAWLRYWPPPDMAILGGDASAAASPPSAASPGTAPALVAASGTAPSASAP